ncbi:MAG: FAD:protein FMN transferase, partial [Calditrichia bacterium]
MKIIFLKLLLFLFALNILNCHRKSELPQTKTQFLMGTFVTISSYDEAIGESDFQIAADSAFAAIHQIENHANPFDSRSEISLINSRTGSLSQFPLSTLLRPLIAAALQIARQTNGAYDPTLWPVFRLWHWESENPEVPPDSLIRMQLKKVDYQNLALRSDTLLVLQKEMGIDLSGISKGFAVERARKILQRMGLENFIIDAGGNLGINWQKEQPVSVYIRHPRLRNSLFGKFPVRASCGVATSGDYQNYFVRDSLRYHHILDPSTGKPAHLPSPRQPYPENRVVSATVWAEDATTADGLSTALFVMGTERALAFTDSLPGVEMIMIYLQSDSLHYAASKGLAEKFSIV